MPSKRLARLNEQLKRELAELIRTRVRDPRVGGVTVTGVDVAGDLASARVHVQLTGSTEDRSSTLEGLETAAPFLRRSLGQSLHVRKVPELRFMEDRSLEQARRIEEILSEVLPEHPAEGEPGEEDEP